MTAAETSTGYWRIGWDSINTRPSRPTNFYYQGALAFAAIHTSALSATQVRQNWAAGN